MKTAKERQLSKEELLAKVAEARQELFNIKVREGGTRVQKPHRVRFLRRFIARLLTLKNEL